MEIIEALNRNNEKTALERRIKKPKKQAKRKVWRRRRSTRRLRHVGMLSGLKQNWQPQPTQHAECNKRFISQQADEN
jgi:hypothetical protein